MENRQVYLRTRRGHLVSEIYSMEHPRLTPGADASSWFWQEISGWVNQQQTFLSATGILELNQNDTETE